jgi:hypothetical protein
MTITITAFERSPDGGKGLARDTRVRWALEGVGQLYEVRLVSFRSRRQPMRGLSPRYPPNTVLPSRSPSPEKRLGITAAREATDIRAALRLSRQCAIRSGWRWPPLG